MNKYELIISYISKYEHIKGQNNFDVNYCLNSGLADYELLLTGEAINLYCSNFKYFEEVFKEKNIAVIDENDLYLQILKISSCNYYNKNNLNR